jgi:MFS family permease
MARFRPSQVRVRINTLDSFRYREFRLLWGATLTSSSGFWVQEIVVGWLTYDLTRSPLITSLALGLAVLPLLPGAPVGGVLADLLDRRKLLVAVWAYQAVVTAGFSVAVLVDRVETWHIFAYVLAMGSAWAVSDPAWFAIVPNIVPRRSLINAFALGWLAHHLAQLAVPAAAGLLIALKGPGPALVAGAVMFLGGSLAAAVMRVDPPGRVEARRVEPLQQFREGIRYVRDERTVLGLILIGAVTLLLLPPFVNGLMPVYASEVFHVGPAGLGLLISAIGIGSTASAILLASLGDVRHKGRAIVIALVLLIAGAIAFSRMPAIGLAIPPLVLLSGALTAMFAVQEASIQSVVPDRLRGRVSSVGTMITGFYAVGSLLGGGLAELLDAPTATLAGSAMLVVVSLGLLLKFKQVWRFER